MIPHEGQKRATFKHFGTGICRFWPTLHYSPPARRYKFKELNSWCAANKAEEYGESCQFVGQETAIAKLYGVADPVLEPMPRIWDSRVAALVLAAPGGELHAFGTTGIAAVKVPTLILVTATDQVVKPGINALWAYDGISSIDKALGVFDKGAHQQFMYSPEPQFNEGSVTDHGVLP